MKLSLSALFAALGVATLLTGCGDNSSTSSAGNGGGGGAASTPPSVTETTKKAVESAAQATTEAAKTAGQETAEAAKVAAQEAAKAAEASKAKLQEAAKAVQTAVAEAGPAAQEKFNALVAEVKKLVADGKGTEAVQKIQAAFAGLKLSPEQQKMVDDLTTQAKEALSKKGVEAATKAATDFLAPKPKPQN